MKKHLKIMPLVFAFALLAASCVGDESDNTVMDATTNGDEMAQAEFADIADLSGQKSFTTEEFNRVILFLEEREVILTGYPYAYSLGEGKETEFIPNRTEMLDGIDNSVDNCSIRIKFKNEEETKMMHIGDLFGVKGTLYISYSVSQKWGNTTSIQVKDAEFIDDAEQKGGDVKSFEDINVEEQIFCGDLFAIIDKHYETLSKKSVEISGRYLSTTTSKSNDGEILEIRVDLGDYDNKVGCEMKEETDSESLSAKRQAGKNVVIAGKFSGITFGNPRISGGVVK
jgi:hypothetical protein